MQQLIIPTNCFQLILRKGKVTKLKIIKEVQRCSFFNSALKALNKFLLTKTASLHFFGMNLLIYLNILRIF